MDIKEAIQETKKGDSVTFKAIDKNNLPVCNAIHGRIYEITYVLGGWGNQRRLCCFWN